MQTWLKYCLDDPWPKMAAMAGKSLA